LPGGGVGAPAWLVGLAALVRGVGRRCDQGSDQARDQGTDQGRLCSEHQKRAEEAMLWAWPGTYAGRAWPGGYI